MDICPGFFSLSVSSSEPCNRTMSSNQNNDYFISGNYISKQEISMTIRYRCALGQQLCLRVILNTEVDDFNQNIDGLIDGFIKPPKMS